VGADYSDHQVLGELLLAWAMMANPEGVVLFSSRDPDRIRANATPAAPESPREQADALPSLVREELSSRRVSGAA